MNAIGIKELHDNIDAVLQRVQEDGETIEIAVEGRIVAQLIPPPARPLTKDEQAVHTHRNLYERCGNRQVDDSSSDLTR